MTTEVGDSPLCSSQIRVAESFIPAHLVRHDRAQLAQSLRDQAIQPIFAVGTGITALAASLDEPELRRRLMDYVAMLDVAASAIYGAVSALAITEFGEDASNTV